ncbi:MAG TPA: enoyl-CoA hydratase-related protein [Rhodoblastus sp.]|nr:enoyl-CoA hydratase-related protein [Rhodoblastus sp.]
MAETISVERRGAVTTIAIARPDRRNALNESVAEEIVAVLDGAERDGACRAIVLTGVGDRAFCAGGDLQPGADGTPFTIDVADPRHYVVRLLKRMDACRLPLVARVNGAALAGGLGLVCACDLVVADERAIFGVTEVKVGLFPMMILPYLLRSIPHKNLMELCLTGDPVKADEAKAIGLVNHIAPAGELDARTDWLVSRIVDKSPTGIRLGKQALTKIREMSTESALEYAQFMLANMARTQDAIEGFAAFNEKRAPNWTGK